MKVAIIAAGGKLSATEKSSIRRHAYFELSRFADKLRRVTIRLSKVATPPLELDHACRVVVEWPLLGAIEAEARHADPAQAVLDGVSRVGRRLARRLRIANLRS